MPAGANDLTTLANVKAYLRLTQTNDDDLIQTLITNVSAFIEQYTQRTFLSTEFTEARDGLGCNSKKMAFANYPVTAVSSLTIDGVSIPASPSFFTAGYRFNAQFIVLNGYVFTQGFQNVILEYTAGFDETPKDIAQACTQLVAVRYRELERVGQSSKTVNGETVNFLTDAMPKNVQVTLDNWKKVMLV